MAKPAAKFVKPAPASEPSPVPAAPVAAPAPEPVRAAIAVPPSRGATLFVKPAPGRIVRNPERHFIRLAEEGDRVPRTSFWLKSLREGDVVETTDPAATPPPTPQED